MKVLNQKLTCGPPVGERPQNRTQYSGDDWRCFGLRWIRRQRLSITRACRRERLTLFCNALSARDTPHCIELRWLALKEAGRAATPITSQIERQGLPPPRKV